MYRLPLSVLVVGLLLTACGGSQPEHVLASPEDLPVVAADADYLEARSVDDLTRRGTLAVRAVAEDVRYTTAGRSPDRPLPVTITRFRVTRTIFGAAERDIDVAVSGGPTTAQNGTDYLLEFPLEPQFALGAEYLLVLEPRPLEPETFMVVGPAQGRYKLLPDDRLASVEADRRSTGHEPVKQDHVQQEITRGSVGAAERTLARAKSRS